MDDVDPVELLERIRADAAELTWEPLAPADVLSTWRRRPMRAEQALDYLHNNWALPDQFDPIAAGGGIKGRLIRIFGRLCFRVLNPYLARERELVSRLVQTANALAERCDEITRAIEERQVNEAQNGAELAAWVERTAAGNSTDGPAG